MAQLNVPLKWAIVQWKETALGARDQLNAMRAAVSRLFGQRLSRAFGAWHEAANEALDKAERVHDLFAQAAARLLRAKLCGAWNQWR